MVAITVSHTAKYSKAHNMVTKDVEAFIRKALPRLCAEFDVPLDVEIIIRPIKKKTTLGVARHNNGKFQIEIDCRHRVNAKLLDTIAHEFTHIEQYHQGRLRPEWTGGQWVRHWVEDGQTLTFNQARTHNAYLNRPWEIEARARAAAFVNNNPQLVPTNG